MVSGGDYNISINYVILVSHLGRCLLWGNAIFLAHRFSSL